MTSQFRPSLTRLGLRRGVLAAAALGVVAPSATLALAADQTVAADAGALPVGRLSPAAAIVDDVHRAASATDRAAERRTLRVARKVAKLRGRRVSHGFRMTVQRRSIPGLARTERRLRRQLRELRRTGGAPAVAIPAQLASIAACESGGNPRAIGGGGAFRGKYQFTYSTWAAVGGSGDPAAAPEAEQDRRAAMLYARAGAGQWPVCGR